MIWKQDWAKKDNLIFQRPWCWERLKAGGEGDERGWDGWMASPTQWAWVSANSGSRWWTGRPGTLQSMGSQSVGHDWVTELTWIFLKIDSKQRANPQLVQFSSVTQSCLTLCDPMNHSTPGLPVHHQLLESAQTHVHWVGDAIQPSHPLSSPSPPALNLSQHQGLFKWVNSSHQVAKVLEFQHQYQSFQWTPRTDLL